MNKYCTMYIARHGETEWNLTKLTQGHGDSPLTENGIAQAKALGDKLKAIKFDAAFSSDLGRAHRTAQIALLDRKLAVKTSHLLRERSFGVYEGRPMEQYAEELQKLLGEKEDETKRLAGKLNQGDESEGEVVARFTSHLREIALAYLGKIVLVVSHGGALRMFLTHLGYATYKELVGGVTNGAYIKILSDGINFELDEVVGITKNSGRHGL